MAIKTVEDMTKAFDEARKELEPALDAWAEANERIIAAAVSAGIPVRIVATATLKAAKKVQAHMEAD